MKTPDYSPLAEWHKLKLEMIQKIEEIDNNTPWSEKEPDWWINMMEVRALIDTF